MALTITLANVIRTVLRKTGLGLYAPNAEITIPSTTTFTWANLFANINLSTHSFEGWLVWRPDSATAGGVDDVRYISSINWTTGVVTVDRAWTDATVGTEDIYILRPPLRPQSLIDAANFAAGKVYFENQEPLSIAVDASFQSSAETAWTEVNTSLTKVTTADSENVYPGMIASGKAVNSGLLGHVYQQFSVHAGEQVHTAALCRADVGTAYLALYDVTNGALIGSSVSHAGEQWAIIERTDNIPAGCETLEVRVGGTGDSDETYWNGLWVWRTRDNLIRLSTSWDPFRIPTLAYLRHGYNIGSGVYSAYAGDLEPLSTSVYGFLQSRPAANPYAVRFSNSNWWRQYPIYIMGRRPYSDLVTFTSSDLSTEIAADHDLFEAEMRLQLLTMGDVKMTAPNADELLQAAYWDRQDAASQFNIEALPRRQRFGAWASLRN